MMQYLDMPTIEEKEENADYLHQYTHNRQQSKEPTPGLAPLQPPQQEPQAIAFQPANPAPQIIADNENVMPENAIIPFEAVLHENDNELQPMLPQPGTASIQLAHQNNSQVITNQLKQAPILFQGATFHGCTINLQVPQ